MALPLLGVAGAAGAAAAYKYYAELPETLDEKDVKNYSEQPKNEIPDWSKRSRHWWVDPKDKSEILRSEKGVASFPSTTVMTQFKLASETFPDKTAMVTCDFAKTWTWKQFYEESLQVARSMVKLGLSQYGSVCIIGFNSPEWFLGNFGAIAAGAKSAGIYTTNGPEAAAYIVDHSEAEIVLCENPMQLQKFLVVLKDLPNVKAIIMWTGEVPEQAKEASVPVLSWEDFMAVGKDASGELADIVNQRIAEQEPGHCSTLIYTSGTTGRPKAVMISQDSLNWTAQCAIEIFPGMKSTPEHHFLSYLPLSHVAAQMLDMYAPINLAAQKIMATVYFARPDALKGTLGDSLRQVRPTGFFGVPRVWEKIHEKMLAVGAQTTGMKKNIASWAKALGKQKWESVQLPPEGSRTRPSKPVFSPVADALVFKKVRAALGLDRAVWMVSGAAPITRETMSFFGSLDMHIMEVYGMSECTGPSTLSVPHAFRLGAVGPAIDGLELKIDFQEGRDKPGHGEICYRGRNIMMGYLKNPEKTQEAIDPDGWLHSGDVGHIDEYGLLSITGRIKELIITAGGENIAPVPIEERIRKELPSISNVMMVGDKRKYNVCLVTLHSELDEETGRFTEKLAGPSLNVNGSSATTVAEARADPKWQEYIFEGIKRANKEAVSNAQKVQKFAILDEDFSTPAGDLTATLKLKRPIVTEKNVSVIEALYN
mmetsp:Transcript_7420/g.21093  ORF Transcript_7420/g.21093 Transcript_7420/m.21093 type:complete len:709 (+) Transcript_7420:94-2220(+)